MDIAKSASAGDKTFEQEGLKVFLETSADAMLDKATIDYNDDRGFVISGTEKSESSCSTSGGGSCRC